MSPLPDLTVIAFAVVRASVLAARAGPAPGTAPTARRTAPSQASSFAPRVATFRLTTGAADGKRQASVGSADDFEVFGREVSFVTLITTGGQPVSGTVAGAHRR
ncbi:hypothetical protein ABZV61_36660 [Streptomyces sp900116325]|uniref:Uncharacterized protein n=1 Tax=Streptomyces sp. 900116325 TaxID=3154295 RepID=A0ABV2UJY3_9ACTN